MKKSKIKSILPDGSYQQIADVLGISYGTVAQYFGNSELRISPDTEKKILEQAKEIVEGKVLKPIKERLREIDKAEKVAVAA